MDRTLLVADDDKTFQRIIARIFSGTDWKLESAEDGAATLQKAIDVYPDVILLDLHMPGLDGGQLLSRIRSDPRLAAIPVIILSGDAPTEAQAAELGLPADAYLSKPFNPAELIARIEAAAGRSGRRLRANPLTLLPGGPAIEEEAARRIRDGSPFAFLSADLDDLTAYNEVYGYPAGDAVLKRAAELLDVLTRKEPGYFAGHMGGDDFALMCPADGAEELARRMAIWFDALAPSFYSEPDRAHGFRRARGKLWAPQECPFLSLSVAIVTNERRLLEHYARIMELAGERKAYLKSLPGWRGRVYLKDAGRG
jgi:CheY-like chemotaxis protein